MKSILKFILTGVILAIFCWRSSPAEAQSLWIEPGFPVSLREELDWPGTLVRDSKAADCRLEFVPELAENAAEPENIMQRVYVLVAPYPTVRDAIAVKTLKAVWTGKQIPLIDQLLTDAETAKLFNVLWGKASVESVRILPEDQILSAAWDSERTWALIPFDQLDPRWKVIRVDGTSPFSIGFDAENYALSVRWQLTCTDDASCDLKLPESNYDPQKLTTLTLTGTTAMARRLAYAIEDQGADFVTANIAPVVGASDFTHVSNEVSFSESCAPGIPLRLEARFCSLPTYMKVLENIGADLVELTGNHNLDWGIEPFLYSLEKYKSQGMQVYGGGINKEEAAAPVFIEHHGNRIAVVGCNAVGPENVLATETQPGAAKCDLENLKTTVSSLVEQGWLVVVTFQHLEYPDYSIPPVQSHDFYAIAEAGAAIVSGSQAHVPQGFAFVGDSFIHFGLGNLLFDQISDIERDSFFDRHYFYNGKYIGNVLETIRQQETMQPRFLRVSERQSLLKTVFGTSNWKRVFE